MASNRASDPAGSGSLWHSLLVQRRVLHALFMREMITRFGRENLGVLWLVGDPMMFTGGIIVLWSVAGLHGGSHLSVVAFAITGYSSVLIWRNSTSRSIAAIPQNKRLLFHRDVRVLDVLIARIVLELVGATCSFAVLSVLFLYFGLLEPPADMLEVCTAWLMLGWFGASLAMTMGAACVFSEVVDRLWHPISYFLFPLSGAAFMVQWMPPVLRKFVLFLPMVHGTEMLRKGWFGNAVITHYSLPYMASCCLVLTLSGLFMQRLAGRNLEM